MNQEANKDLLKEVPYEAYLDMAIVFYVLLEVNTYGMASMLIKDEHLAMWNVTAEEICRRAYENTGKLLPYELKTMKAVIQELTDTESENKEDVMYVLSNRSRSYGAAAILYKGRLEGIGEYLKEDYYVLPSSVHEVIIIPQSAAPGQEELSDLVTEINTTQVDAEEVLSNHAYYYDRKKKKLLM